MPEHVGQAVAPIKTRITNVLARAGGLHFTKWLTRSSPRILMYHRFGPDAEGRRLSVSSFERQACLLKEGFNVVSMATLGDLLRTGQQIPANTVVITVDDGYEDFYRYAFPVLRQYELPATFYVTSGFVDRNLWLWTDVVDYIIRNTKQHRWSVHMGGRERQFDLMRVGNVRLIWIEICQYCLALEDTEKDRFLKEFARQLGVVVPPEPTDDYAATSWNQLIEMSRAGIEVAGHTVTHPRLVKVGASGQQGEIVGCKQRIEEMIDRPVYSFAYPNGEAQDYDNNVKQFVQQAGYTNATVAFPKTRTEDRFELGRYSIGSDLGEFRKILWGARLLSSRLREALGAR